MEEWLEGRNAISTHVIQHFQDLFSSSFPCFPRDLTGIIPQVITPEDNLELYQCPTEAEIWCVMRSLGASKAPGPDGFSALFFQ